MQVSNSGLSALQADSLPSKPSGKPLSMFTVDFVLISLIGLSTYFPQFPEFITCEVVVSWFIEMILVFLLYSVNTVNYRDSLFTLLNLPSWDNDQCFIEFASATVWVCISL